MKQYCWCGSFIMSYGISKCGFGNPHWTIYDAFGYVLCNNGRMSASCKSAFTGTGNAVKYCCTGSVDIFGCHNPFMFNQSTLVLGYLLLYGYDVTGTSYQMRLAGMILGAVLTCFVFYRNHKNRTFKRNLKDLIQEFDITSSRTKWQLCQIICVPIVLCIAELCNMPRAMWLVLRLCQQFCRLWKTCNTESVKGLSEIL